MPPIVDKLKVLHDAVGEEYALGTLDDFRAKMMVPEKRKAFFNAVGRKYSLGDFNEFDKKVTSSYPVPLEQPTPTPPDLTWQGGAEEATKPAPAKPPAPIATPKRAPGEVPLGPGGIDIKIQTPEQRDFQRAAALGNARRERELSESLGIDKRELTVGERVGSFAGNFNKVIVSGVSGIPKLGGMVRNFVGTMLGEDQPIQSRDLYKLGNLIDEKALEWGFTATTPGSEGFLNEVVPSALGSVMIVALSGGTGGGSVAAGEQLVLNSAKVGLLPATGAALKEVGEHMVSRAGLTSANMMGIQEFEAAKAAGASDEMAIGVYFKNLGVGATEAIPLQRAFARINAYTSGGLIGVMKAGTVGSIEEGAQEAIQQYLTNKVAAGSYDPKREPFKDMIQSVGAGMFVGFFMPGIITAMKSMSPEQQEATKLELNKALKEVGAAPLKEAGVAPVATKKSEGGITYPTGDLGKKPVVQGTVAITPEPLATSKDGAGVTVQTYGTGLKDGAGKEYKVETLTATDGTTIHQSEDGTIKGETREEVAQQIALQGAPTEAKEAPAPKAPAGATTVEKKETVTPVGKKTETKTVSPKGTKTSKKVVAGGVTTTTTVTTSKKEPAKKATAKKEPVKKETKKAEPAKETAPAPKAKVVMPYTVRAAAQELGINYDTPEFKKISKEVTGKEHLDDMNEAELAVMLDLVNASAKPKTNAVQERSTAPVPVEPAPGRSKEVGQKVREPQKPAVTRQGQKEKAVAPAPVVPMGNVPAMQQRVVKTKTGEGYATVKKHNLKSGDKIYPIVEMKKGSETIFVNTKGDAFKNKADALAKAVVANRPEVKPKKKAAPAPAPVAEVPKKEVPKKEPAKKKEAPAPSQAWRKKYTAYTTAGLRDFLNNLPPSERNNPANKELFTEMREELRLRGEGKAKKAMERGKVVRGEVAKVDVWYDKDQKSWVIQEKDAEGNQVGKAHFVATRAEADKIKAELRAKKEPVATPVPEPVPVVEKPAPEPAPVPVAKKSKKEPAPKKEPEPAKELPPPAPTAPPAPAAAPGTRVAVTPESMDVLDFLSGDIFPETVDDFVDAVSEISDYAGATGRAKAVARLTQMQSEGLVKVEGKKITPTFEKQGNEYAPQEITEYTPETSEEIYASNSGGKKQQLGIVGAPLTAPNWIQELDIKEFIGSAGKFLRKYFTTRGHLPKAAFDAWNKTSSAQRRYEALAEQAINRLKAQVKKDYKTLTEADIVKLNLALEGKTTDPDGNALEIPTETMRVINDMRNQVDNLTRQIVYSGNVEGELAAKLMSNLGVYLHRSYRKFSDPLWKDEVGQAAFNRAMKFLKDKYPAYSQEKLDGLIEYLLHSPDAPMRAVRGGTMAGMDLSALKKRKDDKELAPEIRALMGVYADPIVNFSRSVAKMSQLITKNLFQQDVFKDGIATTLDENGNTVDMTVAEAEAAGKYLFRDHVPGYTTKIESTGIPSPLDGLYTSKDISDVLAEFNGGQQPNPDWVKFILRGTGAVNLGLTVFSPTTHGRNFFSNTLYFIMNGYKVPFSSKIDDRFSTKVEGNVRAREAERAATVKEQADIGKLQITASEDLAHASKMQSKVDAKVKEIAAIEKRAVKAKESLDKATASSDKTLRKARLDIIGRNLTRAKGRLKAMQDTMAGVSKATELAEARQAGKDLIAKGAPREEIKKAQDKVHRLEKWERESGVFRAAKARATDLAAREAAMAQKGVPIELPSTLETSAWEDKLVEWKQYGLIDEGVSGGMISEFLDDARSRATTDYRGSGLSEKESIKSKAVHGAKKLYQAGDWFWKAIAYENELVRYKKAYPDMAESELKQMVSNIVRDIHPTYSRISKGVRTLRNIPGAGAFVSFPAEVVRTFSNTVVLAKKEITSGNEELRKVGIKRAAGVLTALSLPTMASLATRALMGMDDKDEESLRNNLPEWSRNSTLMYLNKERKTEPYLTTKYRIIDFGAFDPFAVLKKPFTALLFQNQPVGDRIWNSAGQVLKPFVNQQVLTSKVSDALRNQKPNGGNIYNEADPLWMQIRDGLGYITSASAPGIIKSGLNLKKAAAGEKSETGKEYKLNDELLAIFPGARVSTIDITYGTEIYATNEINRLLLQVRRDAMKDVRYANEEEAKAGREAFVRRNKAVLKRARRIYDDAIRLGADPRVLNNIQWPREMEGLWDEP